MSLTTRRSIYSDYTALEDVLCGDWREREKKEAHSARGKSYRTLLFYKPLIREKVLQQNKYTVKPKPK